MDDNGDPEMGRLVAWANALISDQGEFPLDNWRIEMLGLKDLARHPGEKWAPRIGKFSYQQNLPTQKNRRSEAGSRNHRPGSWGRKILLVEKFLGTGARLRRFPPDHAAKAPQLDAVSIRIVHVGDDFKSFSFFRGSARKRKIKRKRKEKDATGIAFGSG